MAFVDADYVVNGYKSVDRHGVVLATFPPHPANTTVRLIRVGVNWQVLAVEDVVKQ